MIVRVRHRKSFRELSHCYNAKEFTTILGHFSCRFIEVGVEKGSSEFHVKRGELKLA